MSRRTDRPDQETTEHPAVYLDPTSKDYDVRVICTLASTSLRVWNPLTRTWWGLYLDQETPRFPHPPK